MALRNGIMKQMATEKTVQPALFDKRAYRGAKPQSYAITPPAADQTVLATLPAYHAYLSSGRYSQYTPDDFTADVKRFGQFTGAKVLQDVRTVDIHQWIGQLNQTMPFTTVRRKIAAVGNYFRWLEAEHVLTPNPAKNIRARHTIPPLPDLLFESEVQRLLTTASRDPRPYLLVLLLLEAGLRKAELCDLRVDNIDFSNRYQPELWVKHSGKQVFKDRKLKLHTQVVQVFEDYVRRYGITDTLFPYTPRTIEQLLKEAAREANISKPVTASTLRDLFVVRSVKHGMKLEEAFEKIGLSKNSYDDARKKYGRLTSEAL
jgi:site-specific recombinase XerD